MLRKDNRLYINDGLYGGFWELRYDAHDQYAARTIQNGRELHGDMQEFELFGPTCDSDDKMRGRVLLPKEISVGDYIEFGAIGAYSLSGRSDFNGFWSDLVVDITDTSERPPT